jgi:cation transport regulator
VIIWEYPRDWTSSPGAIAQEIHRAAFNRAWTHYADLGVEGEETAHRVAWAAVKHRYRKDGEQWVER